MSTDKRGSAELVGAILNGIYEVKRFIAKGGMGEVYEGKNVNSDEKVAIKVILPELASDPKVQAMFLKEAQTLTKLSHPALVQYRVLAQEPKLGCLYIAMDYIDGTSLSEILSSYGPTLAELTALTRRLADGLRVAHDLGAIHRDLSPDNVLLEAGRLERARIIDFGIAKDTTGGTATIIGDGFAGKLGFVAPEQLGDFDREVGPWSDVYSLGLIILSFVRGAPVNMGTSLVDAVEKRRKPMDLSDVPSELRPLLQAMLVGDPKARLRSMGEVIEVIDRSNFQRTLFAPMVTVVESAPPVEQTAPQGSTDSRPSSESPTKPAGAGGKKFALAGGAAAALAVAAGAGYFLMSKPGGQSGLAGAAAEIPCSFLAAKPDEDSGGMSMYGAALNPDTLATKLADSAKGAAISSQYVAPLGEGGCGLVDAVKSFRSTEPLLVQDQAEYELRIGGAPKAPELAGKPSIVVRYQIKVDRSKKFAMYQVNGDGGINEGKIDETNIDQFLATKALVVQPDGSYKFNMDAGPAAEWFGVVLLTSSIASGSAQNLPELSELAALPAHKRAELVEANGIASDMAWFHTVDENQE